MYAAITLLPPLHPRQIFLASFDLFSSDVVFSSQVCIFTYCFQCPFSSKYTQCRKLYTLSSALLLSFSTVSWRSFLLCVLFFPPPFGGCRDAGLNANRPLWMDRHLGCCWASAIPNSTPESNLVHVLLCSFVVKWDCCVEG